MDDVTYRLNRIENSVERLLTLLNSMASASTHKADVDNVNQEYYTLQEAIKLKYGNNCSSTTITTNYLLMPACNTQYVVMAGRKRWKAEIIREWLNIQDSDIPTYAAKYGVPLLGRIGAKYKKYM